MQGAASADGDVSTMQGAASADGDISTVESSEAALNPTARVVTVLADVKTLQHGLGSVAGALAWHMWACLLSQSGPPGRSTGVAGKAGALPGLLHWGRPGPASETLTQVSSSPPQCSARLAQPGPAWPSSPWPTAPGHRLSLRAYFRSPRPCCGPQIVHLEDRPVTTGLINTPESRLGLTLSSTLEKEVPLRTLLQQGKGERED